MNTDKLTKKCSYKAKSLSDDSGPEIAFQVMRTNVFALHTNCLPACNQSLLKTTHTAKGIHNASGAQILYRCLEILYS